MKRITSWIVAGVLALSFMGKEAQAAVAGVDPPPQDTKSWIVCGGTTFNTCASVVLNVGTADVYGVRTVTMHVWNLSGFDGTYEGTVFTKIGFFNTGDVLALAEPPLLMTGPVRIRNGVPDTPDAWVVGDPNNAGGVTLDFGTASSDGNSNVNNGIANACDPTLSPGGQNQLWENPCLGDLLPSVGDYGMISLTFYISGYGNGDLATWEMLIMGQNGPDGLSTQCITGEGGNCSVVPEPSTWLLLGTGLAGLALVSHRRRKREDVPSSMS